MMVLMSLASCGGTITPDEFNILAKTCDGNGGLKYMYISNGNKYSDQVKCNNGAVVTRSHLKTEKK